MKVLLIGDYSGYQAALAARPDVELAVACHPSVVETYRKDPHLKGAFPYQRRPKLDPRSALELRRAMLAFKPDVVQAFWGRALASSVLATSGMRTPPALFSFRGLTARLTWHDLSNFITYLHPRVAGHACESEAVRQAMVASRIEPWRCGTTYGCIQATTLTHPDRDAVRARFAIPRDAFVVGTVATMRRVKGIDLLLRAAASCEDLKNVYWLLLGPCRDPEVARLAQDPRIGDRVRMPGFLPDASSLISAADLFVMPSRYEALCRALLEAMAQGVCPVVSDAGGMKEVVRHGREGYVFARENVPALVTAIRELHADPYRVTMLAKAAQHRVLSEFTPERMVERTLDLFDRVLTVPAVLPVPAAATL
jgi:glycosyltransferase involved in cell wall biosynthesis